jgi:hypothetical protein
MNNYNQVANGVFKEIQIVNGEIVKDIELEQRTDGQKEIISGHINSKPIEIIHELKPMKYRRKTKGRKQSKQSTKQSKQSKQSTKQSTKKQSKQKRKSLKKQNNR